MLHLGEGKHSRWQNVLSKSSQHYQCQLQEHLAYKNLITYQQWFQEISPKYFFRITLLHFKSKIPLQTNSVDNTTRHLYITDIISYQRLPWATFSTHVVREYLSCPFRSYLWPLNVYEKMAQIAGTSFCNDFYEYYNLHYCMRDLQNNN
jgi:hypothetical protein